MREILISQAGFVGVVLGPSMIFKMVSEPPLRSIGRPVIRFSLSGHPPFMSTLQMFGLGREGVC